MATLGTDPGKTQKKLIWPVTETRTRSQGIPTPMAYLNFIKGILGTGTLSMPIAFHQMGYILSPPLMVASMFLCIYGSYIVINDKNIICYRAKNSDLTYPEAAELALYNGPKLVRKLAPLAKHFINCLNVFSQFLILCAYTLFISYVSKIIFDFYITSFDRRLHIFIVLIPLLIGHIPFRNLETVGFLSFMGNVCTIIGVIISLIMFCQDLHPDIDTMQPFGTFKDIILGFGTMLFAYASFGLVLSTEYNMKQPRMFLQMCGVLNISSYLAGIIYITVGAFGYLKYGNEVETSFVLNFEEGLASTLLILLFGLGIYCSFYVQAFPIFEILIRSKENKATMKGETLTPGQKRGIDLCYRFFISILAALLVVVFNEIHLLLALIGFFCLGLLLIVFPCIIHICIIYIEEPDKLLKAIIPGFIAVFSFTFVIIATVMSLTLVIATALDNET